MSWAAISFLEVCDVQGGTQPPKSVFVDAPESGYVRLLQIQDFKRDDKACYVPDKKTLKKCVDDDILIGRYGASVGKILTGKYGAYNVAMVKTIPNHERIDKKYLYHFLISPNFQNFVLNVGDRAAQAGFNKEDLSRLQIPLPYPGDPEKSLKEQKRIAAILDKADGIRRKRQQAIQLADDFLRSVFLDMFGDPVTNPKGWEVKTGASLLKDKTILSIQDGNHGNDHPKVSDFSSTGLPFIAANVVRNGKILFDKCYYLEEEWLDKLRIGFAKPRDVLLTHKGTLGLTAVLDNTFETYIFSPQTTYYRLDENKLIPEYLKSYFDSTSFQRLFAREGIQSTRAYLGITKQKDLPILFPPIAEQKKFLKLYKKVMDSVGNISQSGLDLPKLFHSLSQKSFKGEL